MLSQRMNKILPIAWNRKEGRIPSVGGIVSHVQGLGQEEAST